MKQTERRIAGHACLGGEVGGIDARDLCVELGTILERERGAMAHGLDLRLGQ